MSRFCIVNVDDFGISAGVNRAVIEAHRAGIVTSASLMVNADAAEQAVELSSHHPNLGVGLHVNFTNEGGPPLVPLDDVDAVRTELDHQVTAFRETMGREPTHIDSHHHVHRRRLLAPVFAAAAAELAVPLRERSSIAWCGSFYAAWDGECHPEQVTLESLRAMLERLSPGVTELTTHVGYVDPALDTEYHAERELELATILDPRLPGVFEELDITLISYAALPSTDVDAGAPLG